MQTIYHMLRYQFTSTMNLRPPFCEVVGFILVSTSNFSFSWMTPLCANRNLNTKFQFAKESIFDVTFKPDLI